MKRYGEIKNETIKMVVIADDFTGALDTGIQFAKSGAKTVTLTNADTWTQNLFHTRCDVLVIDSETRHLDKKEAYRIVYEIVSKCAETKIPYIYKKTDSALRGNIGAELNAALRASGAGFLPFVPAFPQMGRYTVGGIHYSNGIPITDTPLGRDPFDPVKSSRVADLFSEEKVLVQDNVRVLQCPLTDGKSDRQIWIYDAETTEDLDAIAEELLVKQRVTVMAGCAGFAASLSKLLQFEKRGEVPKIRSYPLLVLCGSVSEISKRQIAYEEMRGTPHVTLNKCQQEDRDYLETAEGKQWLSKLLKTFVERKILMIDTETDNIEHQTDRQSEKMEVLRTDISETLGKIGSYIIRGCENSVIMVIGGDTLRGYLEQMNCRQIVPVEEIETGTVLSKIIDGEKEMWMISKSGGFGERNLVTNVIDKLGFERRDQG